MKHCQYPGCTGYVIPPKRCYCPAHTGLAVRLKVFKERGTPHVILPGAGMIQIRQCHDWPRAQLPRVEFVELLEKGYLPPGLRVQVRNREYRVVGDEYRPQRLEAVA